jgi:hypothetical protein
VPQILKTDPDLARGAHLAEVHECLTVLTPWAGPLRVDVTWDPVLIRHGLPGTLDWDGRTDMLIAGRRGRALLVSPAREAKEALRSRLYRPGERELRDSGGWLRWRSGLRSGASARSSKPNVGIALSGPSNWGRGRRARKRRIGQS